MTMIDKIEKVGRFVLWVTMAACFALVPLGVYRYRVAAEASAERERQEAREQAETAARLKAERPPRMTLAGMGPLLTAFEPRRAQGHVWFTNVSSKSGPLCIRGTATNPATGQRSQSIPACIEVGPWASTVHLVLMFADGDVANVCGKGTCDLTLAEAAAGSSS